ncbi:hypothetical protein A2U01_0085563, partial [Trifolium medium]|nr:hypothetical protein [Trifolium medium]
MVYFAGVLQEKRQGAYYGIAIAQIMEAIMVEIEPLQKSYNVASGGLPCLKIVTN